LVDYNLFEGANTDVQLYHMSRSKTRLRLGRLSLTSSSRCRLDELTEDLFPTPIAGTPQFHSFFEESFMRDFFISPVHETDVSDSFKTCVEGDTCFYLKTSSCKATKAVILFIDGHERATDYFGNTALSKFRLLLLNMGLDVVIVQAFSSKQQFNLPEALDSVIPKLTKTLSQMYKPRDMIVLGRGVLGSLFAAEFSTHFRIGALVLDSASAELLSILLVNEKIMARIGSEQDSAKQDEANLFMELLRESTNMWCDSVAKLSKLKGILVVIHSRLDEKIPTSHAEKLFQHCPVKRKSLHIFERGGHGQVFSSNPQHYIQALTRLCDMLSHQLPSSFNTFVSELLPSFEEPILCESVLSVHTCTDDTTEVAAPGDDIFREYEVDDVDEDDDGSYVTVGGQEDDLEEIEGQ
jgi:hypothetical protein